MQGDDLPVRLIREMRLNERIHSGIMVQYDQIIIILPHAFVPFLVIDTLIDVGGTHVGVFQQVPRTIMRVSPEIRRSDRLKVTQVFIAGAFGQHAFSRTRSSPD